MATLKRKELVDRLKLEQAISFHLEYNHFPPVNPTFAKSAKEAIQNARLDNYDKEVQLPNGRNLETSTIIDALHLHSFVEHYNTEQVKGDG